MRRRTARLALLAPLVLAALCTAPAASSAGIPPDARSLWKAPGGAGIAVEGLDHALWRMPPEAVIADYSNDGYRLEVREGWVEVEVEVVPLGSSHPFQVPTAPAGTDELATLARHVASGARTRYEAVSRVLSWVARNIRYELDREASQAPERVVDRRTAYCTGIARLSVALLDRLEIEAREVSGYVFADDLAGEGGYHRWIEVLYPDRGWVFSDPLHSHHFVPANYVRLDSERLELEREGPAGEGLFRDRRLPARDLYLHGPPGVLARVNGGRQVAAALRVELEPPVRARMTLSGGGVSRSTRIEGRASTFVGLEAGVYRLEVATDDGGEPVVRKVRVHDRVRTDLVLRLPRSQRLWRQPTPASIRAEPAPRSLR
ncbi:MAG TPA: transglutaminase-like domain-containing protein [Thermoanaerobaculia bacterium]|nr:transglutaminase-like domain-containing protein [Thermoanaerobaculia bacterium]